MIYQQLRILLIPTKKKRYELSLDHLQIRALQGHSQKEVDIKFDEKIPPDFLYHGTSIDNLDKIIKEGIKKCLVCMFTYQRT